MIDQTLVNLLVQQAPTDAATGLAITASVLVAVAWGSRKLLKLPTEDGEATLFAWVGAVALWLAAGVISLALVTDAVTAITMPEYWAAEKVASLGCLK